MEVTFFYGILFVNKTKYNNNKKLFNFNFLMPKNYEKNVIYVTKECTGK